MGYTKYRNPAINTVSYYYKAAVWAAGTRTDPGTLGGLNSQALAINDAGEVVGMSDIQDVPVGVTSDSNAFLWRDGQMFDLGTLSERGSSVANGINEVGQIVGHSDGSAFIWENGVMQDLNELADAPRGFVLRIATDINDNGVIVGEMFNEERG